MPDDLRQLRLEKIGAILPAHNLLPFLTVEETISLAHDFAGWKSCQSSHSHSLLRMTASRPDVPDRLPLKSPQPVEPARGSARVMCGVPRIAMPQIVLDQPQVVTAIGEGETAGMAQHVGMDMAETGTVAGGREDVVHGLPGHRLLPLGHEQPWKLVIALPEPAPDRPQLIAFDGMLDAQPALQTRHPEA